MKCNSCGKNIPNTAKVCPFCRTKLVEEVKAPEPVVTEPTTSIPQPTQTVETVAAPQPVIAPTPQPEVAPIVPETAAPSITETPVNTQPQVMPEQVQAPIQETPAPVEQPNPIPVASTATAPAENAEVTQQPETVPVAPVVAPETATAPAENTAVQDDPAETTKKTSEEATQPTTAPLSKKEQKRLAKEQKKLEKARLKEAKKNPGNVITSEAVNQADTVDINSDSYYDDVEPDIMDTLPPSRYMLGIKIAGALIVAAGIVLTAIYYL